MKRTPAPMAGLLNFGGCAEQITSDYAAQYQPLLDAHVAGWNEGNFDNLDRSPTSDFMRRAPADMVVDGPPPTGRAPSVSGMTRFRYRDAKLAEEHVAFDVLDWYQQLGYTVTPPPGAAAEAPAGLTSRTAGSPSGSVAPLKRVPGIEQRARCSGRR